MSKSVLDAWEGILYPNDRDVVALTEVNIRGRENQGMVCSVACFPPDSSGYAHTHHVKLLKDTMTLPQAQEIISPPLGQGKQQRQSLEEGDSSDSRD